MGTLTWDSVKPLEQFEKWRTILRKWFALSQQGLLPADVPTIDGIEYKRIDDALLAEINRLEHAFPKVEWWPLYQADPPQPQWYKVTKEIAIEMQNMGYAMVRVRREEFALPNGKLCVPEFGVWEVYL